METKTIYQFKVQDLSGEVFDFASLKGKKIMIVNTASKCGFTPQFEGLEKLHEQYADQGLAVIGFPCNQFGKQDPGNMDEITEFCQLNYGVSFPIAEKIDVNGGNAHPLYQFLKNEVPGLLGSKNIKWNFTKFLINRDGQVVERYAPATKPEKLAADIEALL